MPVLFERDDNWFGPAKWTTRLWLILRALFGTTSLWLKFMAIDHISLASDTIISLSMPIFVFVFARLLLNERFGRVHVMALMISIVGIALASDIVATLKQSTQSTYDLNGTSTGRNEEDSSGYIKGVILEVVSTIIGALAFIFIRMASRVSCFSSNHHLLYSLDDQRTPHRDPVQPMLDRSTRAVADCLP